MSRARTCLYLSRVCKLDIAALNRVNHSTDDLSTNGILKQSTCGKAQGLGDAQVRRWLFNDGILMG
ncbi:uncharacterized protein EAF01_004021 [Botrytis porri]|uniref:Uncharacterized protein n=1 Tax=Botrytis porri TaxID=87229 RepID=A0A4Z1KR17_9HELO|nr:uncharacterized protein EAF01_004021 [Botrytis porri]KAF7908266.1 hypothetical protein EAF01_004021 [Botrytis porri]TGO84169.1 hypothetical protein BPOR_0540g00020 [Botrytis porri]